MFRLEPGARLWVVGTMNTAVYGGVYSLNEDLKSRFNMLPLGYPSLDQERRILNETMSTLMKAVKKKTVNLVLQLAEETRKNQFDYALSTRDVVQILNNIDKVGLKAAMWIASGKFEDEDRDTFVERVTSCFGKVL